MNLISVITPTHNPKYLAETYQSLCKQTYKNWEWVVVVNGSASKIDIQGIVKKDERVKIFNYEGPAFIGAIKNFSFMKGTGDFLVELDHDDLLPSNALGDIVDAFNKTNADFVYSNYCEFFENGLFHFYPDWQTNGWRYRNSVVDGREISECVAFKPSASATSLIYYAPNHVRVWRKSFYQRIGGHNVNFPVADDHELIIRTYLEGTMHHIDKCLYLYRMGEQNSFSKRLDEIQTLTFQLYFTYIERLLLREGQLRGLGCYDLGGAFNSPTGWSAVDMEPPAAVVADLSKPWPFETNSVMAFRAHDFIEHIADKQHVMSELHRCLAPGGWALISVPSTDGRGAFQDPTHVSYWNENSFWYYTRPEQAKYIRNYDKMFIERRLFTYFPTEWHKTHNIPYTVAELVAQKGDISEVPGLRR